MRIIYDPILIYFAIKRPLPRFNVTRSRNDHNFYLFAITKEVEKKKRNKKQEKGKKQKRKEDKNGVKVNSRYEKRLTHAFEGFLRR